MNAQVLSVSSHPYPTLHFPKTSIPHPCLSGPTLSQLEASLNKGPRRTHQVVPGLKTDGWTRFGDADWLGRGLPSGPQGSTGMDKWGSRDICQLIQGRVLPLPEPLFSPLCRWYPAEGDLGLTEPITTITITSHNPGIQDPEHRQLQQGEGVKSRMGPAHSPCPRNDSHQSGGD